MKVAEKGALADVMRANEAEILAEWTRAQGAGGTRRDPLLEAENRRNSKEFLAATVKALGAGDGVGISSPAWEDVRRILDDVSSTRATQGHSPAETATFVFSLKQPVFTRLRARIDNVESLADALWEATLLIDALGLYTTEASRRPASR